MCVAFYAVFLKMNPLFSSSEANRLVEHRNYNAYM